MQRESVNNQITLKGTIVSPLAFSHEAFGESFYTFHIEKPRLSAEVDTLLVTVSERLIEIDTLETGASVTVVGQIRSCSVYDKAEGRSHQIISVFALDIAINATHDIDDTPHHPVRDSNVAYLDGYVRKPPVRRVKPNGLDIADIYVAVHRAFNKSDYIPCIVWGRNAIFSERLQLGDRVKLRGRLQSRVYRKRFDDGMVVEKTAYELSVFRLELGD